MTVDTAAIVANAVRVEARPTQYSLPTTVEAGQDSFLSAYLGPSRVVAAATAAALSAALLDRTTYDLGTHTMCFDPGVQLEFVATDGRRVVVKICSNCDMLRIVPPGGGTGPTLFDLAPGHKRLAELVRATFPDNADLRNVQ